MRENFFDLLPNALVNGLVLDGGVKTETFPMTL